MWIFVVVRHPPRELFCRVFPSVLPSADEFHDFSLPYEPRNDNKICDGLGYKSNLFHQSFHSCIANNFWGTINESDMICRRLPRGFNNGEPGVPLNRRLIFWCWKNVAWAVESAIHVNRAFTFVCSVDCPLKFDRWFNCAINVNRSVNRNFFTTVYAVKVYTTLTHEGSQILPPLTAGTEKTCINNTQNEPPIKVNTKCMPVLKKKRFTCVNLNRDLCLHHTLHRFFNVFHWRSHLHQVERWSRGPPV